MRYLGRSLLCFLFGAVAFAALGYLSRPSPSWSLPLDAESNPSIIDGDDGGRDVLWLLQGAKDKSDVLTAVRKSNGAVLRTVKLPLDESLGTVLPRQLESFEDRIQAAALSDGGVFVQRRIYGGDQSTYTEFFRLGLDAHSDLPHCTMKGFWTPTPDGRHAMAVETNEEHRGGSVKVADATVGRVERMLTFGPEHTGFHSTCIALSPDGRTVAVAEGARNGAAPMEGVDLWDVASGRRLRRVGPKLQEKPDSGPPYSVPQSTDPEFSKDGRSLSWTVLESRRDAFESSRLVFDLQSERLIEQMEPSPPKQDSRGYVAMHDENGGRQAWVCADDYPDQAFFWISRDSSLPPEWRKIPYPLSLYFRRCGLEAASWTGLTVDLTTDAVVVRMREEPPVTALPKQVAERVPESWGMHSRVERFRWHDWNRDQWRDVGFRGDSVDYQLCDDALFVIQSTPHAGPTLQSWPLPPRDPIPPAIAASVLSISATWWACARRHRRKMIRNVISEAAA
jgi:hypothetical protein